MSLAPQNAQTLCTGRARVRASFCTRRARIGKQYMQLNSSNLHLVGLAGTYGALSPRIIEYL
jgi:hypothetical protein